MKKVLLGSLGLAALVVLVVAGMVFAAQDQGPAAGPGNCNGCGMGMGRGMGGRMYDPAKAETLSGQVVSVEEFASPRGRGAGVVLKVTSGSETLAVHLGPKWFLDNQAMKFAAGDSVEIKGMKTFRRGQDIFIAGEVKKGGEILKLRDEQGIPLWAGWRRGESKS